MAKRGRRGGGPPRGSSYPSRGSLRNSFVSPSANAGSFSMRDVARNTETRGRDRMWATEEEIRHKPIVFVSGGQLAGTLPDKTSAQQKQSISDDVAHSEGAMAQMNLDGNATEKASVTDESSAPPTSLFFEDTTGADITIKTGLPPPVVRSTSPTPSDSSEEVVLFKGRNPVRTIADPVHSTTPTIETPAVSTIASTSGILPARGKARKHNKGKGRMETDDEAIADYLENIRNQENDSSSDGQYPIDAINCRPLGEGDGGDWFIESSAELVSVGEATQDNPHKTDWDSPDLEDFDQLSTSSEMIGRIARILRKRERSSGLQYLVAFEKTTDDEARWISVESIVDDSDKQVVAAYEENVKNIKLGNETSSDSSWSDASDDEEEDEEDEVEDEDEEAEDEDSDDDEDDETEFEDEEDLIQRKIERMSDEHIARLLAKQEELGFGADELLLFDDDDVDDEDEEAELEAILRPSRKKNNKGKRKDHFPSASLMADVLDQDPYNGFDVMDWDRPSLRKKQKGRKANLPFELSDDELALNLKSTWEKDREKKRSRKKEREELRAQGLLGRKNKFKPDLSAKYDEGMTFGEIRDELRVFMGSNAQSRPFPPMDKHQRAMLHQIGAALGLNSKSVGSGNKRFTTLIKTSRTAPLNDYTFNKLTAKYQRRFLPRGDKAGGGKQAGRGGGGGGGKYGAASYRDGEVVGASAPEIGIENKGRAMLEKMGWSAGMGLGAVDNKGILQPVQHVVKTSKIGLG